MKKKAIPTTRRRKRATPMDTPAMAPEDSEWLLDVFTEPADVGAAESTALGAANVLVGDEPGIGGEMLNAGEIWTLLELESSVILNVYCCVVGMSKGMRRVALPLFGSVAV
jgi:hypothetical protein